MEISNSEVKSIIMRAICYPTVDIKGEIVPVYARSEENDGAAAYTKETKFIKAVNKYGLHSPNCVRAVRIGTDAVIKTMFDGTEVRGTFGYDGARKLEEVTAQVATRQREGVPRLLSCILKNKMSNLEELYIDRQILIIAGMSMSALESMEQGTLVKAIVSKQFTNKLFGEDAELIKVFKRLATVGLGNRAITVDQFKGNWEIVSGGDEQRVKIANRHWVVQEKTYLKDEQLYRYVTEYNKKYFSL